MAGLERQIEQAALRSWPAREQVDYDGWLLRFSDGYTKRANSVNPLSASTLPLAEKIGRCERLYADRGLRPIFRLTPFASPPDLDGALNNCGYDVLDVTLVLCLDLRGAADAEPEHVQPTDLDTWLDCFYDLGSSSQEHRQKHAEILRAIRAPCLPAVLLRDGQAVAVGLGVLDGGLLGVFDVITAPEHRHKGHATRLMSALIRWAREQGAAHAYLQVVRDNLPAMRLYAGLGFSELYRYWYRVPGSSTVDA